MNEGCPLTGPAKPVTLHAAWFSPFEHVYASEGNQSK
jgi:hypothetical protein